MTAADCVLVAMWILLITRNSSARLPLYVLLIDILCLGLFDDFERFCVTASSYFILSTLSNISAKLRYAMLAAGSVYWLGSVDELIYTVLNLETVYYDVMPYLVICLNAYIATVIFMDGGRNIGRVIGRFSRFANRCRIGL